MLTAHAMTWDGPEECLWLFANSFVSEVYLVRLPLPRYRPMLFDADWRVPLLEYTEALQLLAWQRDSEDERGARWVLKAPGHMFRLRELAAAFPDARFIRTHRDPRVAIASMSSLVERGRVVSYRADPHDIGPEVLEQWCDHGLERLAEASDELDPARCWDVDFRVLMADPFAEIERMFDHFGLELGDQAPMRAWLQANPRHGKGRHSYELARYGLSEGEVLERSTRYRRRFAEFLGDS